MISGNVDVLRGSAAGPRQRTVRALAMIAGSGAARGKIRQMSADKTSRAAAAEPAGPKVDVPFLNLTPGTRSGVIHDERFAALLVTLQPLKAHLSGLIEAQR
jgi:hypothetical protein